MKKNKKANHGGFCPQTGGITQLFWPNNPWPCWLSCWRVAPLTHAYGTLPICTLGLPSVAMWRAWIMGVWWTSGGKLHEIILKQNISRIWGDLGFEPRSQCLMRQRLNHLYQPRALFIIWQIIIIRKAKR